eukprot:1159557-Pelagomonas_calceolata.AAC.14
MSELSPNDQHSWTSAALTSPYHAEMSDFVAGHWGRVPVGGRGTHQKGAGAEGNSLQLVHATSFPSCLVCAPDGLKPGQLCTRVRPLIVCLTKLQWGQSVVLMKIGIPCKN